MVEQSCDRALLERPTVEVEAGAHESGSFCHGYELAQQCHDRQRSQGYLTVRCDNTLCQWTIGELVQVCTTGPLDLRDIIPPELKCFVLDRRWDDGHLIDVCAHFSIQKKYVVSLLCHLYSPERSPATS